LLRQEKNYQRLVEATFQTIYPYSDMLLHDMRLSLADGRPDFAATGAILWHGGEAEKSKQAFRVMSKSDPDALLRFLNSL
jgi:CxxC motif-containing protein (DUF1111 family)